MTLLMYSLMQWIADGGKKQETNKWGHGPEDAKEAFLVAEAEGQEIIYLSFLNYETMFWRMFLSCFWINVMNNVLLHLGLWVEISSFY